MTGLTEAKAALERGRHVVLVTPPAVERAGAVWGLLGVPLAPGLRPGVSPPAPAAVIVCADPSAAADWVSAAPADRRVHAVTGLGRTAALLKEGRVGVLAGAAKDLAALVARSALKLESIETLVLAWPEALVASEHSATLDALLAEAPVARRIVLSWNPPALEDFLERHARRAVVAGSLPLDANGRPLPPHGPARFAIVPPSRRTAVVLDALDILNPKRAVVWAGGPIEPPRGGSDAVLATILPTREEFAALSALGEPLAFVSASQLPYLRSIATPLSPLRLPSAADRAQDRNEALRTRITELVEQADLDAELGLLDPLFDRFDPAEVAAALLAISRQPLAVSPERPSLGAVPPTPVPAWVKVFVNVGTKDRVGAKDLVGALIREVGLAKGQIGRIEQRETYSLVEVAPGAEDKAARGLSGVSIKGRRVAARLDRQT